MQELLTNMNFLNTLEFWKNENRKNLKKLKLLICLGIILSITLTCSYYFSVSAASSNNQIQDSNSIANVSPPIKLEDSVNNSVLLYCKKIGGTTSGLVSISTSPVMALTILSLTGALQGSNIDGESKEMKALISLSHKFPVDLSKLPFASFDTFRVLFAIALLLFILRILPYTKIFTFATIDKFEKMTGQVISFLLVSVMTSSTAVFAATSVSSAQNTETTLWSVALTTALSVIFSIAAGVIYYFIKTVCVGLEILAFIASPIPFLSGIFESLKASLAIVFTLLPFFSPVTSLIISLFIIFLSIYLFNKMNTLVIYFKYIYIKPFWNAFFHKRKIFPLAHNKLPEKISNNFVHIEIAVPVFPLKKIGKIKKKALCWLVFDGDKSYICKNYLLKKPLCLPFQDLLEGDNLYMQKAFRFLRIFSDENIIDSHKRLLLVLSREYDNQIDDIVDITGFEDYRKLEVRRKEERKMAKENLKRQKLDDKHSNVFNKADKKLELLQARHDFVLETANRKQLMKLKDKEFKNNLKMINNGKFKNANTTKKPIFLTSKEDIASVSISINKEVLDDSILADTALPCADVHLLTGQDSVVGGLSNETF